MAEIWKPQPVIVYQNWILMIETDSGNGTNDWETRFIEDMKVKLDMGRDLSQGQAEKLEEIYVKYTN